MNSDEIYQFLSEIFKEVFARDDIVLKPDLSSKDLVGWDSFKQVEILMAIEERLNITMRSKELDALLNVGDLASLVQTKLRQRSANLQKL